ncbi:MAG: lysophospholipid acyltransferase family protein, partial [Luteibaculum sp.]
MNSSGEGVKIYCPNHSSYLDIIVCYLVIPHKFLFLGKAELLRWPLFRIFFKHMDIAVNRGNKLQAARSVVQCGKALKTGWSLVIFPEGTISKKAPELFPFKPGAFKIAEQFNVDIVPVSFVGNWRVLNVSHWNSKSLPGRIQAFVHNKLTLPSDLDLSAKREAL